MSLDVKKQVGGLDNNVEMEEYFDNQCMLEKHERHTKNDRIQRQVHTSTNMKKYI